MTTYTYNSNVPASPNNPSSDQPIMLINTQSIASIIGTDHLTFGTAAAVGTIDGQHLQVTFSSENAPGAQTDPISTLYTGAGTASTKAQLYFRNQDGIFPVSPIKAFGRFTTQNVNGAVVPSVSSNVTSVTAFTSTSPGRGYTIALPAGAVNGTNVCVLLNLANGGAPTWTFAANTLTIIISNADTASILLSFAILQV